jgi:hypothetical protein
LNSSCTAEDANQDHRSGFAGHAAAARQSSLNRHCGLPIAKAAKRTLAGLLRATMYKTKFTLAAGSLTQTPSSNRLMAHSLSAG